jgi:hypothetical protein
MTFHGFSQSNFKKAYIVNNNDTIHGFIDYTSPNSISTNCFFQKNSNSKIVKYKPSDLKGFCFDGGKQFISKEVTYQDSTVMFFLEFLLKGVVNLYYCKYKNEDMYFIEKDSILYPLRNDESVVSDKNRTYYHEDYKYIGILKVLLNDAESLSGEIENTKLDFIPLIRLLKDYHNQTCSNKSCIVYYKKENALNDVKWKIKYGVSLGYSFTKLKVLSELYRQSVSFIYQQNVTPYKFYFAEFYDYNITETNSNFSTNYNCLFPALFVNLSRNSKSSFQLELKYKYLKYSLLNFSEIETPIMYNYDFSHYKKINPFINMGLSNVLILGARIKGIYYKYDKLEDTKFNTDHLEPIYSSHKDYINKQVKELNQCYLKLNAGCGIGYTLPNENTFKLEFRCQTPLVYIISGVLDGGAIYESKLSNSNLSISLSYMFK